MQTYLSTEELNRLSIEELEALRGFLLDRLAGIPEGSPLQDGIFVSLSRIERLLGERISARARALSHHGPL